jgi:hypothetical protein
VANDWHAALLPLYVKKEQQEGSGWKNTKTACLLHNLSFQGRFPYDPLAADRLGYSLHPTPCTLTLHPPPYPLHLPLFPLHPPAPHKSPTP